MNGFHAFPDKKKAFSETHRVLKKGGSFISMKGPDGENELAQAGNAIKLLGGGKARTSKLILPDESTRTIIEIKKLSPTPKKYPRRSVKISKEPLL